MLQPTEPPGQGPNESHFETLNQNSVCDPMTCITLSAYLSGFLYDCFYEFNKHFLLPNHMIFYFFFSHQPPLESTLCKEKKKAAVHSFSKDFIKEQINELIQVIHLTQCLAHSKHLINVSVISIKDVLCWFSMKYSCIWKMQQKYKSVGMSNNSKYTQTRSSSQCYDDLWEIFSPLTSWCV